MRLATCKSLWPTKPRITVQPWFLLMTLQSTNRRSSNRVILCGFNRSMSHIKELCVMLILEVHKTSPFGSGSFESWWCGKYGERLHKECVSRAFGKLVVTSTVGRARKILWGISSKEKLWVVRTLYTTWFQGTASLSCRPFARAIAFMSQQRMPMNRRFAPLSDSISFQVDDWILSDIYTYNKSVKCRNTCCITTAAYMLVASGDSWTSWRERTKITCVFNKMYRVEIILNHLAFGSQRSTCTSTAMHSQTPQSPVMGSKMNVLYMLNSW